MLNALRRIPIFPLAAAALVLGLAPFKPEPHLVEKLRWLLAGQLHRPLDIFDLCLHSAPVLLLGLRLALMRRSDHN